MTAIKTRLENMNDCQDVLNKTETALEHNYNRQNISGHVIHHTR